MTFTYDRLSDHEAFGHPSYDAGVHYAAKRAYENKGESFSVYYDGEAIYVRDSKALPPKNVRCICIAQYWSTRDRLDAMGRPIGKIHTVQLRFNGARSEWIYF